MTVKILAACGAGVNSSHQIKDAIEKEFKKRGYSVQADAVMVKDVNEDMMKNYDNCKDRFRLYTGNSSY